MTSTGPDDRSVVSVAVDDTPWCATGAELVADRLFALGASAVSELAAADGVGMRLVGDVPSGALAELSDSGLDFEVLEVDPTWNDGWRDHATVVTVGERLALRPEWLAGDGVDGDVRGESAVDGDAVEGDVSGGSAVDGDAGSGTRDAGGGGRVGGRLEVVLDAADSFGSGSHATTRLCLEVLEHLDAARPDVEHQPGGTQIDGAWDGSTNRGGLRGVGVLDVGSGTGVLGVAAVLLGAGSLVAVDIEPPAVAATRRTAELSGVDHRLVEVSQRSVAEVSTEHGPFDVVLANLLVPIIEVLGPALSAAVAPGGHLVLSGLLSDPGAGQIDRAVNAVVATRPAGVAGSVQDAALVVDAVYQADGWAAVSLHRARCSCTPAGVKSLGE